MFPLPQTKKHRCSHIKKKRGIIKFIIVTKNESFVIVLCVGTWDASKVNENTPF